MRTSQLGRLLTGLLLGLVISSVSAAPRELMRRRASWRIKVASAQFKFKPFELRNLCFDCHRNSTDVLYGCTMRFDWFDPNSVKENNVTACSCKYSWSWDGETVESGPRNSFDSGTYQMCQISRPTFFEMRIDRFHAVDNFTLALGRRYKDTVQFKQPYVYPTTFAEPVIKLRNGRQDDISIRYFEPGPFNATIQGISL